MPELQLRMRSSDGATFGGVPYAKGVVLTLATDKDVLKALSEVGHLVDITRVSGPAAGQLVNLGVALRETFEKLLPRHNDDFVSIVVEDFTDVPAADADGLVTVTASVVGSKSFVASDLNGALAAKVMSPARNVTLTLAGATAAQGFTGASLTGIGPDGLVQQETLSFAAAAATIQGVKPFQRITGITLTGGTGTGGNITVGYGNKLGLKHQPALRDGAVHKITELEDGVPVTTAGTLVPHTTAPPYGTYTPNTAPNGAHTYTLTFERVETELVNKMRGLVASP